MTAALVTAYRPSAPAFRLRDVALFYAATWRESVVLLSFAAVAVAMFGSAGL